MPLIVVDTSVARPATLSRPASMTRKLWVLLAYGAVVYRAEHLRLERDELRALADQTGGHLLGLAALDDAVADAESQRAALAELLPSDTPRDLVAVGSPRSLTSTSASCARSAAGSVQR